MKNTHLCPKCHSEDILRIEGPRGSYGNIIRLGLLSDVLMIRYLCCSCGYTEEWLDYPKDIEAVRAAYDEHAWYGVETDKTENGKQ